MNDHTDVIMKLFISPDHIMLKLIAFEVKQIDACHDEVIVHEHEGLISLN